MSIVPRIVAERDRRGIRGALASLNDSSSSTRIEPLAPPERVDMPHGYIDAVKRCGLIDGWAYDETRPLEPMLVSVVDSTDVEIAAGLAHYFRRDLAEAGFAHGCCHFRLRSSKAAEAIADQPLKLIDKMTNAWLHGPRIVNTIDAEEPFIDNLQQLVDSDPTTIQSFDPLDGCEALLDAFVKLRGVEAFVRAAHIYVFGRAADREGRALYIRLLGQGRMTPGAMIGSLLHTAERRADPRRLAAPNSPEFPFRLDL